MNDTLRLPVEQSAAAEIEALIKNDTGTAPPNWSMSPQAVVTFLVGGKLKDGTQIKPKYIGPRRMMETAVATLLTDRALLLMGVPGTAKSWVSEHLAAAICGDSQMLIQCTAGTDENQVRYGWNYAQLLAHGPSKEALVPTPLLRAMENGKICRLEELTRMPSDVQDTLITVLSEKTLPVPELNTSINASRGFNVIATANDKDKGVNELSAALKRRFNLITLRLPDDMESEVAIVTSRVADMALSLDLPTPKNVDQEVRRVVEIFRELRAGKTLDGRQTLKSPSGTLSTAEAIAVVVGGLSHAAHFGGGNLSAESLAMDMVGAIVKDPVQDKEALDNYLHTVLRTRKSAGDYHAELSALL